MTQYYEITFTEMDSFLSSLGFSIINLPTIKEYVYGKIIRHQGIIYSLRIYTSIQIDEDVARSKGDDAIRLMFFIKTNNSKLPVRVGAIGKTLRIETWQKNLKEKIDTATNNLLAPDVCPICNNAMILKESKNRGKDYRFWGCINYFSGCKGIRNI